ncbi:MAG: TrmH family RNA methyltransferase [Candidatus Electrothrix sp. AS4_5]|nr:TrmH family RNA methyltransferase [Candidatus Electrothrix gigas]MCI5190364.1 TrmH family RNA methyltransferase [Candidatus Electrothrix gigas]
MVRRYNKRVDIAARYEQARRRNLISATPGLHEYILVLDGLKPDFNIGKIFRTADAFAAREIHLIGVNAFNPDSAKGSVRWVPFYHHEDFASCYQALTEKGYMLTVLEPGCSELLGSCSLAKRSAFVMGHEEFGISFAREDYPDIKAMSIPQWGHVQSLNVSVAASIVMYEYIRQHGEPLSKGLSQKKAGVNSRSDRSVVR